MQSGQDLLAALLDAAGRVPLPSKEEVVFIEPCLPRIPPSWSGVLVLAEAQNLAGEGEYVKWLRGLEQKPRWCRLWPEFDRGGANPRRFRKPRKTVTVTQELDGIGVEPWDSGALKLAVHVLGHDPETVAVGNAVPWSQKTKRKTNANPDANLQEKAKEFWRILMKVWDPPPTLIIAGGKIAQAVVKGVDELKSVECVDLVHPIHANRSAHLFSEGDLRARYPEIQGALVDLDRRGTWGQPNRRDQNIFFAAHALSVRANKKRP